MLLHRFEQGRLGLRRGPVDLVGQQHMGEHRTGVKGELLAALAFLENVAAGDVGRQQVGRELDAPEVERQQPRQRLDELGLAESGKAFEQHMASSEQRRDDLVDRLFLAEDHPAQFADDARDLRLAFGDAIGEHEHSFVSGHDWLTSRSSSSRRSDGVARACGAMHSDRRRPHTAGRQPAC
jgi:hypothetical protein